MPRTQDHRGEQIIDSRDIIARFDELETELTDAYESEGNTESGSFEDWIENARGDNAHTLQEAAEEYRALKNLIDQCEGYGDWRHGATLIRDYYFTKYAEDLASDLGDYDPRNARWPYTCLDWEKAADELKQDYTQVDFDGTTYWMRS